MSIPSILVIGNCVIDDIYLVPNYPTEDDELRAQSYRRALGGNACNSAQILASLGHPVALAASLADDDLARWALGELDERGIDTRYCMRQRGYATPHSSIWLSATNGSRSIVHHRNLPELSLQHLHALPFAHYDWVHIEGRNIDTLSALLPQLGPIRGRLSIEIEKPRDGIEQLISVCDSVVISSQYLRQRDISPEDCMNELKQVNPRARLVCTLGKQGLVAIDENGQRIRIKARPVDKVVDSIGAGDCFIAGLISRLSQTLVTAQALTIEPTQDFANSLEFANHLASLKIQHQGMTIGDNI
jgi:ketohexokinase